MGLGVQQLSIQPRDIQPELERVINLHPWSILAQPQAAMSMEKTGWQGAQAKDECQFVKYWVIDRNKIKPKTGAHIF